MEILKLDVPQFAMLFGIIAVVASLIAKVCISVAAQWRRVREAEIEAALKSQMLEQGLSTEEIERVLGCHIPIATESDKKSGAKSRR